jgi:rubredoxin
MNTRKLEIPCPECGSMDVFYSCTPNCCYNHVCSACGTTFEPETSFGGSFVSGVVAPDPMPDSTDPTAECAKCHGILVYALEEGGHVCGICGAKLLLEITEIAPG